MNLIPVYLGLDDTDFIESGCTTERMNNLINYLINHTNATEVERRLVRLWPFAENRTRGNGALGSIININPDKKNKLIKYCSLWFDELKKDINSKPNEFIHPSPCLIISFKKFPENWYWSSVRGHVDASKRKKQIENENNIFFTHNSDSGIVGASAAISWLPSSTSSWELISWRRKGLIGTERMVNFNDISRLDEKFPETFVNRDPTKKRGLIAPRTPCPVLYGIRGPNSKLVTDAHFWLQSQKNVENCSSFAVHISNQLTDDHIISPRTGTVVSEPIETKGGHSYLDVISNSELSRIIAFREGGDVNDLLRKLIPGDIISWTGIVSPNDSVHLEKLILVNPSPRIESRPNCCNRTMRSSGKNQQLRCKNCKKTTNKYWLYSTDSVNSNIWVEPSPSNRRHLSKPLSIEYPIT